MAYRSYPRRYYLDLVTGNISNPGRYERWANNPRYVLLREGHGLGNMSARWEHSKLSWIVLGFRKSDPEIEISLKGLPDILWKRFEHMIRSMPLMERARYCYETFELYMVARIGRDSFYNGGDHLLYNGKYISVEKAFELFGLSDELIELIHNCRNEETRRKIVGAAGGWHVILKSLNKKPIDVSSDGYNPIELHELFGIRYLIVQCPSTGRQYALCPPDQRTDNAYEAWKSMFPADISYRHGDVGISYADSNDRIIEQS